MKENSRVPPSIRELEKPIIGLLKDVNYRSGVGVDASIAYPIFSQYLIFARVVEW